MVTIGNDQTHFWAGSPLNRLSWLRQNNQFLNNALTAQSTRILLLKSLNPLSSSSTPKKLAYLPYSAVEPHLGPKFGKLPSQDASAGDEKHYEGARLSGPVLVFLGIKEAATDPQALPEGGRSKAEEAIAPEGEAYFAVDATAWGDAFIESLNANAKEGESTFSFAEARGLMGKIDGEESGILSQARSVVDWNVRNKYDSGSGREAYSLWAGYKRACPSVFDGPGKGSVSTQGLQNYAHPRTDPVVIMAILSPQLDRMLLGRNKAWPKGMYSCLAGFVEPGESYEEAVRREVWEEAGVRVRDVSYDSSQPWPFPANLMCGFFGIATPDSLSPRVDLDNELEDARWFSKEDVLTMLEGERGALQIKLNGETFGASVPPGTAIAGQLIRGWAKGTAGGLRGVKL